MKFYSSNQTMNSDVFIQQLIKLNNSIKENRPELANHVFQRENVRTHSSLVTQQQLLEFSWDLLPHPPYSPDLVPSDYHLFRSLQNPLNGEKFNNNVDVNLHLEQFFTRKEKKFYERRIMMLHERCRRSLMTMDNILLRKYIFSYVKSIFAFFQKYANI